MEKAAALIRQFHEDQQQYFQLGREQIARRNLQLIRGLSLLTALPLIGFLTISPRIISGWRPTIHRWALLPASLLIYGAAQLYTLRRKPTSRGVMLLCLLFQAVLFVLIILIDVMTAPDAPGSFMPLLCVVLPSLFIVPLHVSYLVMAVFEPTCVLAVLSLKDPFIGQYDIFDSIVGIAFSLSLAVVIARLRARDYHTRLRSPPHLLRTVRGPGSCRAARPPH